MSTDLIIAAGCLVTRNVGDLVEVLLVHRPKYDDWSLPKGKREGSEHITETAVREVLEETGFLVALRQPLPERTYEVAGQHKLVHYWRAEVVTDKGFTPGREVDEIRWLPMSAAKALITHPLDAKLVTSASNNPSTPFTVLRHAHAIKRAAWTGVDDDRPLDPEGFTQADALASRLAIYGFDRVHTSAARRCVQTVAPYADTSHLPVIMEPTLTEDAYAAAPDEANARVSGLMADAVRSGQPTLLCGHRPYLVDLIDHLLEAEQVSGPRDTLPVASMIVLHAAAEPDEDAGASQHRVLAVEHHRL